MTELKIDRQQLLKLRSESHALNPMVLLGQNGLTDAVLKEIGKALDSHGLVKIRIPGDDREERDAERNGSCPYPDDWQDRHDLAPDA